MRNNKIEVARVIDNITERAEQEAMKYYEGNEEWRQMVVANIKRIEIVEEVEEYLLTLEDSKNGLLDEIETQKVSPYVANEYERELMIARFRNEVKEIDLYEEIANTKLKEMEEMTKTIETAKMTEVAIVVAYKINQRIAKLEYMTALMKLPTELTHERSVRKTMYHWASKGVEHETIIDRVLTLNDMKVKRHERLTEEFIEEREWQRNQQPLRGKVSHARVLEDILDVI